MLLKIAWRNLWRNKRRSLIVLTSIVIGVIALVLNDCLSLGLAHQMLFNQIGAHVAHIQIHQKGFHDNPILQNSIQKPSEIEIRLKGHPAIRHYSKRVITFGLLSSSYSASGINIIGIEPEREQNITTLPMAIVEGKYLSGAQREILISTRLAEKLQVELGDKLVAMASRKDGSIGSEVFRVVGLFKTFSSDFDKTHAYIPLSTAQNMLALEQEISEFAVIVSDIEHIDQIRDDLRNSLSKEYEVLNYKDVIPLLVVQVELYEELIWIFYAIVGIAMVFGIINTMLMAVFERIQEFGVLMAMGMPNRKLFSMILIEAFFLGLLGTLIGVSLSYLIYLPLSHSGLDLSQFAESLTSFGAGAIIYPVFTWRTLQDVFFFVPFFSLLGAIYPALKAIKFQPIEAIRYV